MAQNARKKGILPERMPFLFFRSETQNGLPTLYDHERRIGCSKPRGLRNERRKRTAGKSLGDA